MYLEKSEFRSILPHLVRLGLNMKKIQLLPKAEELQKSLQNDNLGIVLVLSLNSMEKKYPNRKKRGSKRKVKGK